MKITAKIDEIASALIIALLAIFLIGTFVAIAMYLTTGTLRRTDSSRDYSGLRSATEGALDFGYGVWAKTVNSYYGPVTQAQLNAALATVPAFDGYGYAPTAENGPLKISPVDSYGVPSASPSYTLINLPKYPGWTGKNYSYLASVRLTGTTNGDRTIKYGAKRLINYSVVPLFQATAFFEDNLELYKTAPMTIGGLVHTNSTAYVSSSSTSNPSLTFTGNLSYVSGYSDNAAPPWLICGRVIHLIPLFRLSIPTALILLCIKSTAWNRSAPIRLRSCIRQKTKTELSRATTIQRRLDARVDRTAGKHRRLS